MTSPGGNVVEIVVRVKDLTQQGFDSAAGRAKGLARQIDGGSGSTGAALESAGRKATGFGAAMARVGTIAGGILVADTVQAGARRALALMQSTVQAASALGESVNAVGKVFEDQQTKIQEFGKTAAEQIGLSQRAFNQAVVPLGSMLKNTGMSLSEVADETINLTKRAADMASIFDTSVEDAIFAISAAFRGETEPIRRYGVTIDELKIQQKALATTGKAAANELTAQEKAAARLSLIFEQTASTAGDFQATSDGLANSSRKSQAAIEDAKAALGEAYLPILAKAAQVTEVLARHFSGLSQPVQIATAAIVAIGAAAVIVVPRILAMKAALDSAAAAGSRAAVGLSMAANAALRFAPWLVLLDIQKRSETSLTKVGEAAADASGKQHGLTEEIETQAGKLETLISRWEQLHGLQANADKEALQAQDAIAALGDTFKENGFKTEGASRAARENRVALTDAARAAAEAAQAYLDQTGDAEGAAAMMDEFRRQAERSIGATGKAKDEVHKLAAELFKLPPTKEILITANIKVNGQNQLNRVLAEADRFGGFAHGGISGAASGGNRGGLVAVGEQGPELVRLPYGSTVIPSGTSREMMRGGRDAWAGGGVRVIVEDRTSGGIRARAIEEGLARGVDEATLRDRYP